MILPVETNNVTDMFPPTTFDPSSHCEEKWGVAERQDWTKTQLWGNGTEGFWEWGTHKHRGSIHVGLLLIVLCR